MTTFGGRAAAVSTERGERQPVAASSSTKAAQMKCR
jgi:hypothetical protein